MTDKQVMTEFTCNNCHDVIRVSAYKALSVDEVKDLSVSEFYACCDNPDYLLRYSGRVNSREITVKDVENIRKLMREGYSVEGEKCRLHCQSTDTHFYGAKFIEERHTLVAEDS